MNAHRGRRAPGATKDQVLLNPVTDGWACQPVVGEASGASSPTVITQSRRARQRQGCTACLEPVPSSCEKGQPMESSAVTSSKLAARASRASSSLSSGGSKTLCSDSGRDCAPGRSRVRPRARRMTSGHTCSTSETTSRASWLPRGASRRCGRAVVASGAEKYACR
jgi:hypothetical protein